MAGFSQNDPEWRNDPLGTDGRWTVGQAGCLITSGSDVLNAFGHYITPGELNRLAQQNGLITADGDVTRWDWLSILFPDICQYIEHKDWGSDSADLAYFDIRNDLNTEIILMIDDSPSLGMQTHFMRTVGWDGDNDVLVDDVWDGIRKGVNAYGQRWNPPVHAASIIYNATKYIRAIPPAPTPEPAPAVVPEPTPVTPPPDEQPTPVVAAPESPPVEPIVVPNRKSLIELVMRLVMFIINLFSKRPQ